MIFTINGVIQSMYVCVVGCAQAVTVDYSVYLSNMTTTQAQAKYLLWYSSIVIETRSFFVGIKYEIYYNNS